MDGDYALHAIKYFLLSYNFEITTKRQTRPDAGDDDAYSTIQQVGVLCFAFRVI